MAATIRNQTSSSATSEYFRTDGGYYVGPDGDAESLRAKREERREVSAWHGKGAAVRATLDWMENRPARAASALERLEDHALSHGELQP